MNDNHQSQAIDMCAGKSIDEISSIILESKLNNAHPELIHHLQQMFDLSMEESHALERKESALSAWTNYCRTSWIYRLFERIGLR
jgi:hypothetical protein